MTTTDPTRPDGATAPAGDDDLRRVVAAQAALIEQLQRRLDRLEGQQPAATVVRSGRGEADAAVTRPDPAAPAAPATVLDAPTSRRHLVTKGAAAAATAVIGTAVVGAATASPASAASGTFDGNPAVSAVASPTTGKAIQATSTSGTALRGETVSGFGVYGTANAVDGIGVAGVNFSTSGTGTGVAGQSSSPNSFGVSAVNAATTGLAVGLKGETYSTAGIAVSGDAFTTSGATTGVFGATHSIQGTAIRADAENNGVGVASRSDRSQFRFDGSPASPPGSPLTRTKGELAFDVNADLWLCIADGTPGTWRRVSGAATAGAFTVLASTVRIYDSRAGQNPVGVTKGQLGNFAERTIDAKTNSAVPAGATAVLVNLTIVNTGSPGYLGLFKNGITYPGNSTINWNQPGTLLANSAVVALDDQARFAVKSNVGFCDFVIDAIGYYR